MRPNRTFFQILIELFLIVSGVLAALAVENWRESIGQHALEREYLINLRDAIQADTTMIRSEIKRGYEKEFAARRILELVKNHSTTSPEEFGDIIESILMLLSPAYSSAVYEDLKYTGNLKIIRNDGLKRNIITYYATIDLLAEKRAKGLDACPNFVDLIDIDELTYRRTFSQETILARLAKSEPAKHDLRDIQRFTYYYNNSMIYTSLPKCLEILDLINHELETR